MKIVDGSSTSIAKLGPTPEMSGVLPNSSPIVESRRPRIRSRWNFAEWFILCQTIIPGLLYLPGSQAFRVPIRLASYGITLAALAYVWQRKSRSKTRHPSVPWLIAVSVWLGLMLAHPTTNSFVAGLAQIMIYLSVFAPVFWVPVFVRDARRLRRVLWLLLLCNGINAFVGVMQVRDPATWMPREFSSVITSGEYGLASLTYQGADGRIIIRPPGLLDAPGAVCGPAMFAVFLGLVFCVSERAWWRKALALALGFIGAQAIYLTLVRTSIILAGIMLLGYICIQFAQGRAGRALSLLALSAAVLLTALSFAAETGGSRLWERFGTIIEGNPKDFYYENRGAQVQAGFTELLPEYPLGAGLGRWGMMNSYFGNRANLDAPTIWAEIQFPAWIVDGGIVLMLLYLGAIFAALVRAWRLSVGKRLPPSTRLYAGITLAASIGIAANSLSYPAFCSPTGMQFWFLAGALQGISCGHETSRRAMRRRLQPEHAAKIAPVGCQID